MKSKKKSKIMKIKLEYEIFFGIKIRSQGQFFQPTTQKIPSPDSSHEQQRPTQKALISSLSKIVFLSLSCNRHVLID
jgi:hypothetical protein